MPRWRLSIAALRQHQVRRHGSGGRPRTDARRKTGAQSRLVVRGDVGNLGGGVCRGRRRVRHREAAPEARETRLAHLAARVGLLGLLDGELLGARHLGRRVVRENEDIPLLPHRVPLVVRNVERTVPIALLGRRHVRGRLRTAVATGSRGLWVRERAERWRPAEFASPRTPETGTGTPFRAPSCESDSTACPG